jgi:cobalt/nickel transport system permease protein
MHIPDGFLEPKILISTNIISLAVVFLGLKKLKNIDVNRIPLMGVLASFVFVLQILAFPVIGGTSVHLEGVVLTAILLGPFSSSLIVFCVLLMQALLFQHGGILSLGANFLNIGIVGSFLGYYFWKIKPTKIFASFATFITILISATLCSFELYLSNRLVLSVGLPTMLFSHLVAGIIEAVFVYGVLSFIEKLEPQIFKFEKI